MSDQPAEHPADHEPHWLFLRQVRHPADEEHEAVLDVFYCARCLGRQEVLERVESIGQHPGEIGGRRRGPLPSLGSAVRLK